MEAKQSELTIQMLRTAATGTMPAGSSVWLYGSRARGSEHEGSDWDILVLLEKSEITDEDFTEYGYPFIVLGWHHGADVSPQLYTTHEWQQRANTPFYNNVERDKKIIYGT